MAHQLGTDSHDQGRAPNPPPDSGSGSKKEIGPGKATIIGSLIIAVASIVVMCITIYSSSHQVSSQDEMSVGQVLAVDTWVPRGTNQIPPSERSIHLSGNLKFDLPSGKQIFVAARAQEGESDTGEISRTYLTFTGPCEVNVKNRSFDCNQIWLGSPGLHGSFFVYLGLADSNASKYIVDALVQQSKGDDGKNFMHKAPAGFDALPQMKFERK